jgi:EpsI family protein
MAHRTSPAKRLLVVAATLLAGALYLAQFSQPEPPLTRDPLSELPMVFGEWTGRRSPEFAARVIAVLGVDDYILREYSAARGIPVGLYVGYHGSQRQGDTMHSPLNCLPGAGWQPLTQGLDTFSVRSASGEDAPITVNRVVIGKGLERQMVFYWYQSQRRVVANEYWGKIYTVLDAIRYNRTDAALIRVMTPIVDRASGGEQAAGRARTFVTALFPLLGRHL